MALVNGGFSHYMDMKKFLKKIFSKTAFEIIPQECSFGDPVRIILICL